MWKQFLTEYLTFTKKERTGIFILLGLIMLCLLAPFFYPYFIHHPTYDHSKFDKEISQLKIQQADSASGKYFNRDINADSYGNNYADYDPPERKTYAKTKGIVFYFDPNTASADDWKKLGIREKTAETIQKYIAKGGHFYTPGDISKIWGLHKDDIERLLPYVRIENKIVYSKREETALKNNRTEYNYKERSSPGLVNINSADSDAFIALPGIGNKLAQRIISFRDKLGGFYSVDQVRETYGLPDSVFQKIKPKLTLTDVAIKQININTATVDEMKTHPYIRYSLANAFMQYRKQHGNFSAVADIKKIMIVTNEIYNKVSSYLTVKQ